MLKSIQKSLFTDNNIHFSVNLCEDSIANLQLFNLIKSVYILDKDIYVHRLSIDSICTQKLNSDAISEITETLHYINNNIDNMDYIKGFNYHFIDQFIIKFILEYQSPVLYSRIYDEVFEKLKDLFYLEYLS